MAKSRKPTPEMSKIERAKPLAYSRRQKPEGGKGDVSDDGKEGAKPDAASEGKAEAKPVEASASSAEAKPVETSATKPTDVPEIEPPPPKGEPWPDATPQPMKPVAPAPARARSETIGMPAELDVGAPPEVPEPGSVESPTRMPGPKDVPEGNPEEAALPPGLVPPGDSRSLRKGGEFALVYRVQTAVIMRFGVVGKRGQWRVVEYPTSAMASNAYAKEVSRFVAEGFSDYRE
jgi:hypothetical protein